MRLSDDELRAALRAEADGHQPDRSAMLQRITAAAMTDPARTTASHRHTPRRSPRMRLAAVGAAVAALFAGGGVANWALAGNNDRPDATPVVTSSPAASPDPTATTGSPSASPSPSRSSARPTGTRSPEPTATASPTPPASLVSDGPLWSDGSVDPDSGDTQGASVVTLKTAAALTGLQVDIRVARTEGLVSRGGTKHAPGGSVTVAVIEESDALVYRFTLSSADTLPVGEYTFTAKYTYASGGRDAGGDTYAATATADGSPRHVSGDFF
ncbi:MULTISPECIES: hypothetical protein [Actinoplanes]|uniref:hypothetical protein n=1 Tax=Actinoplanes TaxID=1865 RepID=UPI000A60BE49|nr:MULTISPECIES: hypothetical protein [Actinoplanes]GLY05565.1 hypothetical protein Acsp01_59440 [Actinoplanes sp. NBRC 101535]